MNKSDVLLKLAAMITPEEINKNLAPGRAAGSIPIPGAPLPSADVASKAGSIGSKVWGGVRNIVKKNPIASAAVGGAALGAAAIGGMHAMGQRNQNMRKHASVEQIERSNREIFEQIKQSAMNDELNKMAMAGKGVATKLVHMEEAGNLLTHFIPKSKIQRAQGLQMKMFERTKKTGPGFLRSYKLEQ